MVKVNHLMGRDQTERVRRRNYRMVETILALERAGGSATGRGSRVVGISPHHSPGSGAERSRQTCSRWPRWGVGVTASMGWFEIGARRRSSPSDSF